MTNQWRSEPLAEDHELGEFDCGVPDLNQWLTGQARRAQAADTARTYVWAKEDGGVVAYYTVAPTQLHRRELSRGLAGGYSVVPAFLLARLALDTSLHGQGHGADLLVDALTTILHASERGAGRLIVVDAIDERAAAFYRHHDLGPVVGTPNRLVMKVATARQALGIASLRFSPDPAAQLGSIVYEAPDGSTTPVIVTMTELESIRGRLTELTEDGGPDAEVDLNQVLLEVLGRNPLRNAD